MKKPPTVLSVAEYYHQETRYSPENLWPGARSPGSTRGRAAPGQAGREEAGSPPDPLRRPPLFKEYLSERTLDLKPFLRGPSSAARSGVRPAGQGEPASGRRDLLRSISRLLYHTAGITDIRKGREGSSYCRAAPSAGALYPIEVYLASSRVPGLPDCIHSYSPREHALVPVWEGDFVGELLGYAFQEGAAREANLVLILTAVFSRSAWRYGDRAYRRVLLDAGHLLGNAAAYGPDEGFAVPGIAGFQDAAVNHLLFLDGEEEAALVLAPVLEQNALEGLGREGTFPFPSPRSSPPSSSVEKSLLQLLHERSSIAFSPPHRPPAEPMPERRGIEGRTAREALRALSPDPGPAGRLLAPSVGPVIRRRRSARAFGKGRLSLQKVTAVLASAFHPVRSHLAGTPAERVFLDPTMIEAYLVATRVEGIEPGVHRLETDRLLPPAGARGAQPEAGGLRLSCRRQGDFQDDLWNICLGNELGRDSSLAVILLADLPACVERYGDRAYRYLHLDAGHLAERLNLAASARGVGASGLGSFFDEEVNGLLGLPERFSALYITLLGTPTGKGPEE